MEDLTSREQADLWRDVGRVAARKMKQQTGELKSTKSALREAKDEARTDQLTGLPNKRAFDERLEELAGRGEPIGLVYFDVDRFKDVNDTHGHEIGDEVLKSCAILLSANIGVRSNDGEMLARIGGDEFAALIILKGRENNEDGSVKTNGEVAEGFISRVKPDTDRLAEIVDTPGLGISIGFAKFRDKGFENESIEEFRHRADSEMYGSKTRRKAEIEMAAMGDDPKSLNPNNYGANFTTWIKADKDDMNYKALDPELVKANAALKGLQPGIYKRLEHISSQITELQKDLYGQDTSRRDAAGPKYAELIEERAELGQYACAALVAHGFAELPLVR